MNFKIGDRVTAKGNILGFEGPGTITQIDAGHSICEYMVRFDRKGFPPVWAYNDTVKPLVESKIVITSNGPVTLARLYEGKKVVKRAEAKCAPSDTFDFAIGAGLAYERLMGGHYYPVDTTAVAEKPAEPKLEPVKLYCVKDYKPGEWVTNGKVYEIDSTGHIRFDDGYSPLYDGLHKNGSVRKALIPLVSRPAKVGEWVLVTSVRPNSEHVSYLRVGEIRIVNEVDTGMRPTRTVANEYGRDSWLYEDEYMVLDGYDGRYETPAPKEMTVAEIEKQLGYPVKVVKGEGGA